MPRSTTPSAMPPCRPRNRTHRRAAGAAAAASRADPDGRSGGERERLADCTSVVLVGVESTGKTTLAQALAAHTGWPWVDEVARRWLEARDGHYEEADLETLARLQWAAEEEARARSSYVVVDTDLLVIDLWSRVCFGRTAPWIEERLAQRPPATYLLLAPDLPWAPDPLRTLPRREDRERLHQRFRDALAALGRPWREIGGVEDRLGNALRALREMGVDA